MLIPQPQRPLARPDRFSACIDATSPQPAELIVVRILSDDVGLRDVLDIKAAIALLSTGKKGPCLPQFSLRLPIGRRRSLCP